MSHFSTVKTKLANRECLVQALQDLKLNPQVHETAQSGGRVVMEQKTGIRK
ncbi:hypothetical protein LC613_36835 [Nostoc sphaeroides CHAB 2801]|uniref:hypothetical protein n=1 Tax=Nostoc sphaeroides TaxID=446679 RepID=UPI001E5A170F|nr:hypothetical protein [Nostoc sphaeroides]MCC5633088.1 hypothetical protein [Nostoc sphaeroides CHAB 2801]